MKFSEICEKIRSGEFTIDQCGHTTNDLKRNVIERYERMVANAAGANDGKWGSITEGKAEDPEKVNAEMRSFYQRDLDREFKPADLTEEDDRRIDYVFHCEDYCFSCGETLHYSFNGNGLSLNIRFNNNKKIKDEKYGKLFGGYGAFEFYNCEYQNREALSLNIQTTGKLIFANWFPEFSDDCPEGKKYTTEYSLNSLRGRINIAEWKAKNQNIFYTQVGSCGCTNIWINKPRNHGFITVGYLEDDEEVEFLKDYKCVGRTDVAVWRVEVADYSKVDLNELKKRDWKINGAHSDVTAIKVPKGEWKFTSHYDVNHPLHEGILAEFTHISK